MARFGFLALTIGCLMATTTTASANDYLVGGLESSPTVRRFVPVPQPQVVAMPVVQQQPCCPTTPSCCPGTQPVAAQPVTALQPVVAAPAAAAPLPRRTTMFQLFPPAPPRRARVPVAVAQPVAVARPVAVAQPVAVQQQAYMPVQQQVFMPYAAARGYVPVQSPAAPTTTYFLAQ